MDLLNQANLRAELPMRFGDAASLAAYVAEVNALRATLKPGQVVVAPRVIVYRTRRGRLTAGDTVQAADLLDQLDDDGRVIEVGTHRFHRMLRSGELIEQW